MIDKKTESSADRFIWKEGQIKIIKRPNKKSKEEPPKQDKKK